MLKQYFLDQGEKPFRSSQIIEWLYRHQIDTLDEMTNIKKDLTNLIHYTNYNKNIPSCEII